MTNRINYLDGLRGLAILLVFGFHAFSRWPNLLPYGDNYAEIALFKYGWLGVELFFLISGFVILMTLEKSQTASNFLYKRWLRLFPAMLLISLLVFATAGFFHERPAGSPNAFDLLPGLTFIEPDWWSRVLGYPVESLEGAYWSLYVEVKFYVIAALVFFWRGREAVIICMFVLYAISTLFSLLPDLQVLPGLSILYKLTVHLTLKYFGWFGAGAAFYIYYQTNKWSWYYIGLIGIVCCSAILGLTNPVVGFAALIISAIFALSLVSPLLQRLLASRLLLPIGACSYPLYLMHENALISSIIKLDQLGLNLPGYVTVGLVGLALVAVATLVSERFEPKLRVMLTFSR